MAGNFVNAILNAMGLFSSLFGGDNSANSARLSYEYSRQLQEHQYDLNRKTRQTAFQDTRQSLEQAGYNPLLAVGQQAQGGTFGATLPVTDEKTENLQNRLAKLTAYSGVNVNSAQAKLHKNNAVASIINALNNTKQTNAQIGLMAQQTTGQAIQNQIQQATGMATAIAQLQNIKANTGNTMMNTLLNKAQIGMTKALTSMYGANAQQVINLLPQSAVTGQWYKNHPKIAGFGIGMQQAGLPALGGVATGVGSAVGIGKAIQAFKLANKIK